MAFHMIRLALMAVLVLVNSSVQAAENLRKSALLGGHMPETNARSSQRLSVEASHLKLSMTYEELNQESMSLQATTTPTGYAKATFIWGEIVFPTGSCFYAFASDGYVFYGMYTISGTTLTFYYYTESTCTTTPVSSFVQSDSISGTFTTLPAVPSSSGSIITSYLDSQCTQAVGYEFVSTGACLKAVGSVTGTLTTGTCSGSSISYTQYPSATNTCSGSSSLGVYTLPSSCQANSAYVDEVIDFNEPLNYGGAYYTERCVTFSPPTRTPTRSPTQPPPSPVTPTPTKSPSQPPPSPVTLTPTFSPDWSLPPFDLTLISCYAGPNKPSSSSYFPPTVYCGTSCLFYCNNSSPNYGCGGSSGSTYSSYPGYSTCTTQYCNRYKTCASPPGSPPVAQPTLIRQPVEYSSSSSSSSGSSAGVGAGVGVSFGVALMMAIGRYLYRKYYMPSENGPTSDYESIQAAEAPAQDSTQIPTQVAEVPPEQVRTQDPTQVVGVPTQVAEAPQEQIPTQDPSQVLAKVPTFEATHLPQPTATGEAWLVTQITVDISSERVGR